jgi:hypothetical protein
MRSQRLDDPACVDAVIGELLLSRKPAFLEVTTSLAAVLPASAAGAAD